MNPPSTPINPPYGQLEKAIIAALTEGKELSALQLSEAISRQERRYSIQAVYSVLRKLRRNGVVVKVGDTFSISIPWALDIIDLAKKLEDRILLSPSAAQVIPDTGETFSWTFSTLLSLDEFWTHLITLLLGMSDDRTVYNFCPHPWFYFLHSRQLEKFYRTLLRRRYQIVLLIGGDSFLDRYFADQIDERLYRCKFGSGKPVGGSTARHIMVIGDFIIKVTLNRQTALAIDSAFKDIDSTEHHEIRKLDRILGASGKTKLQIQRHPRQAGVLRKAFITSLGRWEATIHPYGSE